MELDRLLDGLGAVKRRDPWPTPAVAVATEITAVTHDSRSVVPGALFCCVPGGDFDGHDFAPAAVAAGASALLVERPLPDIGSVPQVAVASVRRAMPVVAAAFHGDPSRAVRVVGVTGTNGKTTVTHLLQAVLRNHGWSTEVIGTISGPRTTPEAPELQGRLAAARDAGTAAVAMEVSSHTLAQHRVDATWFAAAVFTNLSQDHLDYHHTIDEYFAAKASLFEPERAALAVVGVDDPWGLRLRTMLRVPVFPFSMTDAVDLEVRMTGSTFVWRGHTVQLALAGRFNVANALATATTAEALGVPVADIAAGLAAVAEVPGRFEPVDAGQPFSVVVDYAHTPDGLTKVLSAAAELVRPAGGQVLVVFGCGGDRDRGKRPLMGEIAARLADRAYLTSDNPRSEDPIAILDAVRSGVADPSRLVVEPDRAEAIGSALHDAGPGDIVVIAGKGHETGQEAQGVVTQFDDRVVARKLLEHR